MRLELKKAIIDWLIDNEHRWLRVTECSKAFRQYIYDDDGEFIIGGEEVNIFIHLADELLFHY